jgi:hypothetical protein
MARGSTGVVFRSRVRGDAHGDFDWPEPEHAPR